MKLDGERFFKRSMVVLLTLRAECSLVTLKPAHLSPYLPLNALQAERESQFPAMVKVVGHNAPDRPLAGDRVGSPLVGMQVGPLNYA